VLSDEGERRVLSPELRKELASISGKLVLLGNVPVVRVPKGGKLEWPFSVPKKDLMAVVPEGLSPQETKTILSVGDEIRKMVLGEGQVDSSPPEREIPLSEGGKGGGDVLPPRPPARPPSAGVSQASPDKGGKGKGRTRAAKERSAEGEGVGEGVEGSSPAEFWASFLRSFSGVVDGAMRVERPRDVVSLPGEREEEVPRGTPGVEAVKAEAVKAEAVKAEAAEAEAAETGMAEAEAVEAEAVEAEAVEAEAAETGMVETEAAEAEAAETEAAETEAAEAVGGVKMAEPPPSLEGEAPLPADPAGRLLADPSSGVFRDPLRGVSSIPPTLLQFRPVEKGVGEEGVATPLSSGGPGLRGTESQEEEEGVGERRERRLRGLLSKVRFLGAARRHSVSEFRVVNLPALSFMPPTPLRPQVVAVFSGKGGVGKSTIALNLAAYLSHVSPNLSVCEVDLDIEHGDAYLISTGEQAEHIGEEGRRIPTIYDFVRAMEVGAVKRPEEARPFFVVDGYSGCVFLAAPHYPSQGAYIKEEHIQKIFEVVKALGHNLIIFDCGVSLRDEITRFALMSSQQIVLVTEVSTSSINRILRGVSEILSSPEYAVPVNRMKLVLNKVRGKEETGIDPSMVRREFGFIRDVIYFEYDPRVAKAWNYGLLGIYTPAKGFKLSTKKLAEAIIRDFQD